MSVLKFELKEEHLKLLKHLSWGLLDNKFIVSTGNIKEDKVPFGGNNLYEEINLILNGKPKEFDPLNTTEFEVFSEEEKKYMDTLFSELPTALDIILYNQKFELGHYKTRYHLRDWKKLE